MKKTLELDINGNYTHNPIGYCHFQWHKGAITKEIARKHHCKNNQCHYLEKYDNKYWDTGRKRRHKINKKWR